MKRSALAIPLLVLPAALIIPAGSATGAPPDPVDVVQKLAAGEACPFPIQVAFEGKTKSIDLPNNPHFFGIDASPGLRVTVTNLSDPSKTVMVNATGAFRYVTLPDGGTGVVAGGHNFLYGEPQVGATALATTGPIEIQVVNGEIAAMDLSGAQVRDICEELS